MPVPAVLHLRVLLLAGVALAACATSGGPADEGTGSVNGGGHVDGGDGASGYDGANDGGMDAQTTSDASIRLADAATAETGATGTDAGPSGHMECPTTDDAGVMTTAYATEYINAPPTATPCTMGGAACLAYVECCFIDQCVPYPAP